MTKTPQQIKNEVEKEKISLKWIIVFTIIIFILGIFLGSYISYKASSSNEYILFNYACDDGCSIGTKDNITGYLTNNTFDCWDKCESYINEIYGVTSND